MKRKFFTVFDAALLFLLIFACAALFWFAAQRSRGGVAVIEQNGVELCRLPLRGGQGKTTYTTAGELPVTITVEDGEAWFETAACPDQICVRTGRLSRSGEAAACLPAGVVLRIEGEADNADAMTG